MQVRERFSPKLMAADSSLAITGPYLGGFLAKTSGTISVTAKDALGTSDATLVRCEGLGAGGELVKVDIRASDAAKCVRCWHRRRDVGSDIRHPELCSRCVENVEGAGETRRFA